jgi:hypothetical protein
MPQGLESLLGGSEEPKDTLERIKLFLIKNENKPCPIKDLAQKLRLSQKDVQKALEDDADRAIRKDALFYLNDIYLKKKVEMWAKARDSSELEKIRLFFTKTGNQPCAAEDIAEELHTPTNHIRTILNNDVSGAFHKTDALCLNNTYFNDDLRIESLTNAKLRGLIKDEKFVLATDIFTRAIANANSMAYEAAQSFGLKLAYLYYVTQEHEHVAWEVDRPKTDVEKRLAITQQKSKSTDQSDAREGILKNLLSRKKEGREKDVEIMDIILTTDERQPIYDHVVEAGLAEQTQSPEFNLVNSGRAWRHHMYHLKIDKIQRYANQENVLRDILNNQETLRLIYGVMDGSIAYVQQATAFDNTTLENLKKAGFIKIESIHAGSADAEPENATQKYEVIRLSVKLLKHSPHLINKVLETDKTLSLEHTLSMLNFDFSDEDRNELKKLGINTKEDLRTLAATSSNQANVELPRFFEPTFSIYDDPQNTNEDIRRAVIKDYEGKWRFSDAVAYVVAQPGFTDESLRPKLEVLLVKLGKDAKSTHSKLFSNNNTEDMKAQAKFGNATVVKNALNAMKQGLVEKQQELIVPPKGKPAPQQRPYTPQPKPSPVKPTPKRVETLNKFTQTGKSRFTMAKGKLPKISAEYIASELVKAGVTAKTPKDEAQDKIAIVYKQFYISNGMKAKEAEEKADKRAYHLLYGYNNNVGQILKLAGEATPAGKPAKGTIEEKVTPAKKVRTAKASNASITLGDESIADILEEANECLDILADCGDLTGEENIDLYRKAAALRNEAKHYLAERAKKLKADVDAAKETLEKKGKLYDLTRKYASK